MIKSKYYYQMVSNVSSNKTVVIDSNFSPRKNAICFEIKLFCNFYVNYLITSVFGEDNVAKL